MGMGKSTRGVELESAADLGETQVAAWIVDLRRNTTETDPSKIFKAYTSHSDPYCVGITRREQLVPKVTIIRSEQYEGRLRKMKISVDGEQQGWVRDGDDLTLLLPPGRID